MANASSLSHLARDDADADEGDDGLYIQADLLFAVEELQCTKPSSEKQGQGVVECWFSVGGEGGFGGGGCGVTWAPDSHQAVTKHGNSYGRRRRTQVGIIPSSRIP